MCYNFKTSIISFSIGLISAILAFLWKMPIIGTLILFYCQMQLAEAIIWRGIDTNNTNLNKIGTSYAKYSLPSHNIGISLGILLSIIWIQKKKLKINSFIPLFISILFYLVVLYIYKNDSNKDSETFPANKCTTRDCGNPTNRLNWKFPHRWYIFSVIISFVFIFVYANPLSCKLFISGMLLLTFLLSSLIYPNQVGSVWCFAAAITAPIIVIGCYLLSRKDNQKLL